MLSSCIDASTQEALMNGTIKLVDIETITMLEYEIATLLLSEMQYAGEHKDTYSDGVNFITTSRRQNSPFMRILIISIIKSGIEFHNLLNNIHLF